MIAVDILPQKSDLFNPICLQDFDLFQNRVNVPTSLSSSDKRDDTEGTHVVTAPHDGQEGAYLRNVSSHRSDISICLLDTELYVHLIPFGIVWKWGLNQFG